MVINNYKSLYSLVFIDIIILYSEGSAVLSLP